MSYFLSKVRINTHFNQLKKHFKSSELIESWLADCPVQTMLTSSSPFEDQYQMTAHAAYVIHAPQGDYNLALKMMQSTRDTTYCFDVFFMLSPQEDSDDFKAIANVLSTGLDALRHTYNGDWLISDDDLTMSAFK